jgi:ketosteroid isomerase-like protein
MSAGDVELLRELYAEWERGDFSREIFADEIVSQNRGFVDMDSGQRGLDEVVAVQRAWLQQWERPFRVEAEEFLEAGDVVVVLIRWVGRGKGSGAEVESEGAHVWEIRDGKAVRWDVYRDRGEALAYAGLAGGETKAEP